MPVSAAAITPKGVLLDKGRFFVDHVENEMHTQWDGVVARFAPVM
jgi:hypothetical protein